MSITKGIGSFKTLSGVLIAYKTADETVNNSDVLQDDDELFVTVPSGGKWWLRFYLKGNSSAVADLKIKWDGPAASALEWWLGGTVGMLSTLYEGISQYGLGNNVSFDGAGGDRIYIGEGLFIGGDAGTFKLTWAQNTAEATDTKIKTRSFFLLTRID